MRLKRISMLFASTLMAVGLILAAGWMISSGKAAPAVMAGSAIELPMPKMLAAYGPEAPDSPAAVPQGCDASLAAYWKLEETYSGTGQGVYADYSNNGNNLTNCSGATCPVSVTAVVGNGQEFVKSQEDGIRTSSAISSLSWTTDSSFSIEAWMDPDACNERSEVAIGSNGGLGKPSWWLGCRAGTNGGGYFELSQNETQGVGLNGALVSTGSWHHLAAVRDGTAKTTTLYVDGVGTSISDSEIVGGFSGTLNTNNFVSVGWYDGGTITDTYRVNGLLDEVAIFNKALSSAEVLRHYNGGLGRSYCNTNTAPSISQKEDQTSSEGQTISLQISATDAEHDTLTFSATDLPTGLSINPTTGLISGIIDQTDSTGAPRVHNVQITVSDNGIPVLPPSTMSFKWTVNDTPTNTDTGKLFLPLLLTPGS